jgi:hypothetical protein
MPKSIETMSINAPLSWYDHKVIMLFGRLRNGNEIENDLLEG